MKKIMLIAAAAMAAMPALAQESKETPNDSLVFTTIIENPVTSIKNQNNSGTCWSYSALAFLESEAIKKNPSLKEDLDLCESFLVSKTYVDRADRNVRTHGDASFSQGGSFYDAIFCMKNYGLIPEGIMINDYFGECPTEFEYKGKKYTPKSFVSDYLKLDPNDYVSLTSYTHQPFYESFILEIQDNWRWASSYNLPLDEFMRVMEESVKNGWTFAWGADVSEDGFSRRSGKNKCVATVPDTKSTAGVGSDQSRWTGEKAGAKIAENDNAGEKTITQELRQEGYDNWTTTDDHGMQIYGIAKDQNGKEYFMMKNSWGEYGPYKGFWYVSKPYVAYKTMNIIINKNAVPKDIRKKLGI